MQVALVLLGLSLLVLWHELGHAVVARLLRLDVTDISLGFGPTLGSKVWLHVRWRLGLIPFGGFVSVAQLSLRADEPGRFRRRAVIARLLTQGAGSAANFLLAAIAITIVALVWGQPTGQIAGLEVTQVSTHAASAGLRVGDRVQTVEGTPVRRVADLSEVLRPADGKPTLVQVRRGGQPVALTMRPLERNGRWGLGARYVAAPEMREATFAQAIGAGAVYPFKQALRLLGNASAMLVPSSGVRPVGPVGLADRVSRTGVWDARRLLSFGALLSVVVGLFNLLPIPGLDGGRIVLEAVESVRRRRVSLRVGTIVQVAGAVALLALWMAVTLVDAARLSGR